MNEPKCHTFREGIEVLIGEDFTNDSCNGTRLWEAGMLLCRYLEQQYGPKKLRGKRVLELGCGTGLVAFYCAKAGASVVACDNEPLVLELCRRNMEANRLTAKHLDCRLFDWSNDEHVAALQDRDFDLVIGADCVFSLSATQALCKCLSRVCKPNATVGFMSVETRDDAVTECFRAGMQEEFDVSNASLKGIDKEFVHEDLQIFRFQKK
jgi:predicted nicotinamide N-methyase